MKSIKIEIPQGYEIDEEKSTFTNVVFKPIEKKWVDLGLPSGTLWCDTNKEGYYTWNKMMKTFDEESLPKLTDFAELYDYCDWKWDSEKKGMIVTGRNGNNIFLPASGCRNYDGNLYSVGDYGHYWSASPGFDYRYYLSFTSNGFVSPSNCNYHADGHSVRLIKRTKK